MSVVSASEAKQGFASIIEAAAREPVIIQRHERDVAVEFRRVADRTAALARERGLTPAKLDELLQADD